MLLGCLLTATVPASACSVPVFRYALERWPADLYEVFVFLSAAPTSTERALVERLSSLASDAEAGANIAVAAVDPAKDLDESLRPMWEAQKSPKLPWMVVRYPRAARMKEPAWAGPLTEAAVTGLVDSPARKRIAQRLADGQTAVWVLLESGNAAKDDAAAKLLDKELKRLQTMLKLPEPTGEDPDAAPDGLDLPDVKIGFSLLRVSRNDPAEQLFLATLLNSEPDLHEFKEPMAFAVFGRGRALFALVGAGINAANIEEDSMFLVGPCSCQVKWLNPGTDLVMSVNWDAMIRGEWVRDAPLPPLPGLPRADAGDAPTASAPATAPAQPTSGPVAPRARAATGLGAAGRNVLIVVLLGVIGLVVATIILKSKRA